MFTALLHHSLITKFCAYDTSPNEVKLKKTGMFCLATLETVSYIGAFVFGYLIHINSVLPSIKGRMQLGTVLITTGITCLTAQSLYFSVAYLYEVYNKST